MILNRLDLDHKSPDQEKRISSKGQRRRQCTTIESAPLIARKQKLLRSDVAWPAFS